MNGQTADGDRQRLLDAVLAGDLARDAGEVEAACAQDPSFRRELDDLLQLQVTLAQRAQEVREDLAGSAPELERAAELAIGRLLAPSKRRATRTIWLAAAACVLAALGWWAPWSLGTAPQFLGGLPVRASDDERELRITWSLAPGQHFEVLVVDAQGRPVRAAERFDEPKWRPDAALLRAWAAGWQVQIRVVSSDSGVLPSARVVHWSPPDTK